MRQTVGDMHTFVNVNSRALEDIFEAIRIGNVRSTGRPFQLYDRPTQSVNLIRQRIRRADYVYKIV